MKTDPISLDNILSEFSDDDNAWVLQDRASKKYVTIPDPKYPGRSPIRFFLSEQDAKDVLKEILKDTEHLRGKNIVAVQVKLKEALVRIATGAGPDMADSFVVHSPNEVYEFLRDRQ